MQKDDIKLLQDVQKNTDMAIRAIESISNKVYDDSLSLELTRESINYTNLRNKALDKIVEAKCEPYQSTGLQNVMLSSGIQYNTLLNTSTSHIAELMINGSNRGITQLWRSMNENERASRETMEIAEELVNFEKRTIEQLRKYL